MTNDGKIIIGRDITELKGEEFLYYNGLKATKQAALLDGQINLLGTKNIDYQGFGFDKGRYAIDILNEGGKHFAIVNASAKPNFGPATTYNIMKDTFGVRKPLALFHMTDGPYKDSYIGFIQAQNPEYKTMPVRGFVYSPEAVEMAFKIK